MSNSLSDTHPDIRRLWLKRLGEIPASRKWEMVGALNRTLRALALSDLRHLYPQASEAELWLRLAHRIYGTELATRVYGPLPPPEAGRHG